MIKVDENDPVGELEPSFPYKDVTIRRGVDVKEYYTLEEEIGRGKFGTVYRCKEKLSGFTLAAKFVGIARRQDRKNVEHEVEIMRSLHHPRLIQLYDAFEDKSVMCVVLELIEGGELFERVIDDDFVLTEKSCTVFMRQICEGVEFIHAKQIVHLDLKPENILCLSKTGNRIKIIDFGLARKYDPNKKLQVLFGTPEFVAPEVVNFDQIDYATDMWSVGVICYVLLSGLSPFMGETDVQTMSNVTIAQYDFDDEAFDNISEDAKDFIARLLVKDKEARLTASQCLSHPWLHRKIPPPPPSLDSSKENIKTFVDRYLSICPINPSVESIDVPAKRKIEELTEKPIHPEKLFARFDKNDQNLISTNSNVHLTPIKNINQDQFRSISDFKIENIKDNETKFQKSFEVEEFDLTKDEPQNNTFLVNQLTEPQKGSSLPLKPNKENPEFGKDKVKNHENSNNDIHTNQSQMIKLEKEAENFKKYLDEINNENKQLGNSSKIFDHKTPQVITNNSQNQYVQPSIFHEEPPLISTQRTPPMTSSPDVEDKPISSNVSNKTKEEKLISNENEFKVSKSIVHIEKSEMVIQESRMPQDLKKSIATCENFDSKADELFNQKHSVDIIKDFIFPNSSLPNHVNSSDTLFANISDKSGENISKLSQNSRSSASFSLFQDPQVKKDGGPSIDTDYLPTFRLNKFLRQDLTSEQSDNVAGSTQQKFETSNLFNIVERINIPSSDRIISKPSQITVTKDLSSVPSSEELVENRLSQKLLKPTTPWFSEYNDHMSVSDRRSSDISCFLHNDKNQEGVNLAEEIRKLSAKLLQMSNTEGSSKDNSYDINRRDSLPYMTQKHDPISQFLANHGVSPIKRQKFKMTNMNRDVPLGSPPPPSNLVYYMQQNHSLRETMPSCSSQSYENSTFIQRTLQSIDKKSTFLQQNSAIDTVDCFFKLSKETTQKTCSLPEKN